MDSSSSSSSSGTPNDAVQVLNEKESMVDPFLVEALQNPRHRLTILRMELDIQRLLQSPDQHQFEFQHFPTSYLRLAAHRAAQHYGLQTMVLDNGLGDGQGSRILVMKTPESKYPQVCLSEIPTRQSEADGPENVKIVIRPRPNRSFKNEGNEGGAKRNAFRTVEERKEEYDRARARIFSGPNSPESEDTSYQTSGDVKPAGLSKDGNETRKVTIVDPDRNLFVGVGDINSSSRVAILRDREKDRIDPDYDRSYNRYTRNIPVNPSFNVGHFNMQKIQPPFVHYDPVFSQVAQMPPQRTQAAMSYGPPSGANMNPFCAVGVTPTPADATAYMQWSAAAMMYAQHSRHAAYQAPFCQQQLLSFDYSQNR